MKNEEENSLQNNYHPDNNNHSSQETQPIDHDTLIKEELLRILNELNPNESIGNKTLRSKINKRYPCNEKDYFRIRNILLNEGKITRGRGKGGSVKLASSYGHSGEERQDIKFHTTHDDEEIAVDFMHENFTQKQIIDLLPPAYQETVKKILLKNYGSQSRVRKIEYVYALITKHGLDLLADKDIRTAIAKKKGLSVSKKNNEVPGRWVPGSSSVRHFVEKIGFPESFQGSSRAQQQHHIFYPGKDSIKELQDYQKIAKDKIMNIISQDDSKAILQMPTGTGKTRTAVEAIYDWFKSSNDKKSICIWVTHTEELCEQVLEEIDHVYRAKQAEYSLDVFRVWGNYRNKNQSHTDDVLERLHDDEGNCNFFSTITKSFLGILENKNEYKWIHQIFEKSRILLVIDEAHRAAAPGYEKIINGLTRITKHMALLGLTATPRRATGTINEEGETERLWSLFHNRIISPFDHPQNLEGASLFPDLSEKYREYLIHRKILARPQFIEIKTNFTPQINGSNSDINWAEPETTDDKISKALDYDDRRNSIVSEIKEYLDIGPTLYFSPTIKDADLVAWLLRREGIEAVSISSETKQNLRRSIIEKFKKGKIKIICNCQLLTTGFDYTKIENIIIGRPTISTVLYEQMIGRGLRGPQFNGTEKCNIINFIDNWPPSLLENLAYKRVIDSWKNSTSNIEEHSESKKTLHQNFSTTKTEKIKKPQPLIEAVPTHVAK